MVDSDRDDVTIDTGREALIRSAVAHIGAHIMGSFGYDPEVAAMFGDPAPSPEAVEEASRSDAVRLAARVAVAILYPEWGHVDGGERPADIRKLAVAYVNERCGRAAD